MRQIDITFNFVGMCVAAWQAAFDFFTGTLGMKAHRRAEFGDWACLGGKPSIERGYSGDWRAFILAMASSIGVPSSWASAAAASKSRSISAL